MNIGAQFWSELIDLNRRVDSLIAAAQKAVEPTQPISREIPFLASLEARFDDLPTRYTTSSSTTPPASNLRSGQNIKRVTFENGGSRVYVREIGFAAWKMIPSTTFPRNTVTDRFPPNWRWNFETSITNRKYADRRVAANAVGRWQNGSHIAFREPLVIEPREGFTFECELLSFGQRSAGLQTETSLIIAMNISGYREAM